MSFSRNSAGAREITGTNSYYPFGLNHIGGGNISPFSGYHSYKFGGKELQETGMYDFGARIYMPDIARWGVIDPLAEMMRRHSPYNYAFNNPISFVDPDGMAPHQFKMITDTRPDTTSGWTNPNWLGRGNSDGYDYGAVLGSGGGGGSDDVEYYEGQDAVDKFKKLMNPDYKPNFSRFDFSKFQIECPKCRKTKEDGRKMVASARSMGLNFAADNMEYFLNGTNVWSSDRRISSRFLMGNSSIRHGIALNVAMLFGEKFNQQLGNMKLGETIVLNGTWKNSYYASMNELDLLYGSGGYTISTTVSLKVTRGKIPGANGYSFAGNISVSYFDSYNWDAGKGDYVPGFGYTNDNDFDELVKNGQAANFNMTSDWSINVSDWGYFIRGVQVGIINKIMQSR